MEKDVFISKEGLERLQQELDEIEKIKLKEVAAKIAEAKDLGDLSENAEYHEAKQQQAFLFGKAQELKYKIKHAKLIDSANCDKQSVNVGCTVVLKNGNDEMEYSLVGSEEADPLSGKISVESPIGYSLLDHKVGDEVAVKTPAGEVIYSIIKIK